LNPEVLVCDIQLIRKNFISTKDSWFPNIETHSSVFFKIDSIIDRPFTVGGKFPGYIMRVSSSLFEEATFYEREVYNLIDFIGEMGGVIEIFILVFGLVIYPISK
jgi:hypothetical protein